MFSDVEIKIKKKNSILFSRESECLQELRKLISEQRHTTLVMWIFDCLQEPLAEFNAKFPDDFSAQNAYDYTVQWSQGKIKMPVAKRAILDCHAVAKKIDDAYYIALCHAIGQGCGTVHVETHALGLPFYELTAIVIKNNYKNYEKQVSEKINYYIDRLLWWQDNIDEIEKERPWAEFLIRPNKVNKEKLLLDKK